MASWTETRLKVPGYRRYVLAGLTLDWMCTQLVPYLNHVSGEVHADLIDPVAPHPGHRRPVCHGNGNTYKEVKACSQKSCGDSVKFLDSLHVSGSIHRGWRNSQIELWEAAPWSIALLYMNAGQDPTSHTAPKHTDISGVLNLMEHCSRFRVDTAVVTQIRECRNVLIHHNPNFEVTEADFHALLSAINKLLTDPDVTPHVTGDVSGYLDDTKRMNPLLTFKDEVKVFQDMMRDATGKQKQRLADLNAEVLKQTATIDQHTADIAQNKASVAKNTEDIDQHTIDIAQNKTEVAKNIEDIDLHTADIAENKASVAKNTEHLELHTTDIAQNKASVANNTEHLELHTTDIAQNKASLAKNTENIDQHTNDIDQNKASVASNTEHLELHTTDIAQNKASLAKNTENIDQHTNDIDQNKASLAKNTDGIDQHTSDIDQNKAGLANNTEYIEQHTADIAQNKAVVAKNTEDIDQHTLDIAQNKASVAKQTEDIDQHTADIAQNKEGITGLKQQITEIRTTAPVNPMALRSELSPTSLQKKLLQCYSRPEYKHLNPLVDADTLGHYIESVFVEMSVEELPTQLQHDVTKHSDKKGKPIGCINEMIPPHNNCSKVLLTGFVGSGKSTVCLHLVHQWTINKCGKVTGVDDKSPIHQYQLVFLLRAKALEADVYQSIANLVYTKDYQTPADDIKSAIRSSDSILILFDGYDEASAEQKQIVDDVAAWQVLPEASVIITSRPNFFFGKVSKWYNNLGFTEEQQLRFMDKFKASLVPEEQMHIEKFQKTYLTNPNAKKFFNSPMIAMTTCTMVASGEEVELESRVQNYKQLTDFLLRRACHKSEGQITAEKVNGAMGAFREVTYNRILQSNAYHFSQDDIVNYISQETFDSIIIHLGYLSVTKYIYHLQPVNSYSFVHKSWAEFTAAQHVMSLNTEDRRTAVQQLFQSGQVNLEILRFVLGLCCMDQPEHLVGLITAFTDVVVKDQHFLSDSKGLQQETETIKANYNDISNGSAYLMLLLTDVDPLTLPPAAARALSRVCAAIWRARLREDAVSSTVQGRIDVSGTDRSSARALYASHLLTAHSAQGSLHTVREVAVQYVSESPYSTVTRLPATLALCAPKMTALNQVRVDELASATELGDLCNGLLASGLRRLTHITLKGTQDMLHVAGCDLGPVARVIRTAVQLMDLTLYRIHCGEERQLRALCAAVGEAAPQLTHLKLKWCSVSPQQYRAVLVPALHRRRTAGRARLQEVVLGDNMDWGRWWRCCCFSMSGPECILRAGLKWEAESVDVDLY